MKKIVTIAAASVLPLPNTQYCIDQIHRKAAEAAEFNIIKLTTLCLEQPQAQTTTGVAITAVATVQ